jgi:hypothetical protein
MQNPQWLDTDTQRLLDFIGGESLEGSGFENEQPESGFSGDLVADRE